MYSLKHGSTLLRLAIGSYPLTNYEISFEAATDGRRADGDVGGDDALVADPVLLAAVAAPAAAQGHGARRRRGRGRDGGGGRQFGLGEVAQQEEEAFRSAYELGT